MIENLDNSCVIENIDLSLYKYRLIHKQNINNYLVTEKQKKFQKFKSYASTAILLLVIIRVLLQLRFYKNPNFPLFYYDLFNYFGGLTQFVYAILLFGVLMCLRLHYLFNHSRGSQMVGSGPKVGREGFRKGREIIFKNSYRWVVLSKIKLIVKISFFISNFQLI